MAICDHFADDIFKGIVMNENYFDLIIIEVCP